MNRFKNTIDATDRCKKKEDFMKNKAMSMLLAGMLAVSVLAGCGNDTKNETQDTAPAADGSTELSIWVHETDSSEEGKLYGLFRFRFAWRLDWRC